MDFWLSIDIIACLISTSLCYNCHVGATITFEPGLGEGGALHSANYPQHYPSVDGNCTVLFRVCPGCSLQLEFQNAQLPTCEVESLKESTINKCDNRCEYFIWQAHGSSAKTFVDDVTSLQELGPPTSDIHLTFCYSPKKHEMSMVSRLWAASFHVVDGATKRIHGTAPEFTQGNHASSSGSIMSPGFPSELGTPDGTYIYYFEGQNTEDRIYIAFSDFDVYDRICPLKLIDGKSSDARVSIFRQPTERPFFGSSSKYLFVEYTTTNQEAVPCLGWRLEYRFVTSSDISLFPAGGHVYTDCGVPQMHRGGTIDFHGLYSKPVYYDCVWKLHTDTEMRVSVKMLGLTMESEYTNIRRLQVIEGQYSTGHVLATLTTASSLESLPELGLTSNTGFYIRLQAPMAISDTVQFAYGTYEPLSKLPDNNECNRQTALDDHWAHPGFVCNGTRRCISQFVVCDGYDHCGDRGDEDETWCEAWTAAKRQPHCPPNYYNCAEGTCRKSQGLCRDGVLSGGGPCTAQRTHQCGGTPVDRCYSDFERCNHVRDCKNEMDENDCQYEENEIDGRFMSALKGFWTSVESTWYFYLPAAVLICGLLLVLCVYKCKQSSDLKKCRQHRVNGNADISQPMIGGDRKDQYEAVTPSECSDGGKPMLATVVEGLEGVAVL